MITIAKTRFGRTLFLRSADKGGAPGGSSDNTPKNLSPEQQLVKARDDLATAQNEVARLKPFEAAASEWQQKHDQLKSQFDELTKEATKAKADLTTVTGERDQARNDLTTRTTELKSAKENVTRLESLCGIKGIDHTAAPGSVQEPTGEHVFDQWVKATGAAKMDLFRANREAIYAEAKKRGVPVC